VEFVLIELKSRILDQKMSVTFDKLRKNNAFPLIVTTLGIAVFILVAALSGAIQGHFRGEEFAVIHHANSYDHFSAWQHYVYEVGRPVAVAYWIYSYEIIGYNPIISHALSFFQVLLAAVTAAVCFSRAMPNLGWGRYITAALVALFFFNWVSMDRAFTLSGDQSHLSMFLFFLSGLSLQQWASHKFTKGQKNLSIIWLVSSFVLFGLCLLTYEAASFVFPTLLLLAWPLVPHRTKKDRTIAMRKFFVIGFIGLLFVLIPYYVYSVFTPFRSHLLDDFSLKFFLSAIGSFFQILLDFGIWLTSPGQQIGATVLAVVLFFGGVLVARAWNDSKAFGLNAADREKVACVYLGCVLLILGGILPFAFVGITGSPRAYHTIALGLPPIMLMSLGLTMRRQVKPPILLRQKLTIVGWGALVFLTLVLSLVEFKIKSDFLTQSEFSENAYFLDMKEIIPAVRPDTIFIFIDRSFSSSGCGAAFNMLYDQEGLRCASFSSSLEEFRAIRGPKQIIANRGGRLSTENWIIIRTDENGKPQIVPELSYGDYGLIITWLSMNPIKTDYARIEDFPPPPSDFYLYLVDRQEFLSQSDN
jgi:hypothetical protein